VDSCDPATGKCINTPITCNDGNACTEDVCVQGICVFKTLNVKFACTDANPCTVDTCNPNATKFPGCVHTPVADNFCDDFDPCTIDRCDVNLGRCVRAPVVCNASDDPCEITECVSTFGCISYLVTCGFDEQGKPVKLPVGSESNSSNTTCNTVYCDSGDCKVQKRVCAGFVDSSLQVIAGVGAGIIAGLIIGIIAAVVLCTGGATFAYQQIKASDVSVSVKTNPLYESTGKGGDNPLFGLHP